MPVPLSFLPYQRIYRRSNANAPILERPDSNKTIRVGSFGGVCPLELFQARLCLPLPI